ncbi:DUF1641 domain-containing protein [Priestia megaterium]|uniref:DUF1641 domain-containing protein n=1 Tax=Priestia megaterium TaxID=1404 RepID=UPI0021F4D689|nr:DUF1641 domain-containing protein [Priestia megaterium]UYP11037.1 DUF1641 domain-containing protein [Priestia megaterium]
MPSSTDESIKSIVLSEEQMNALNQLLNPEVQQRLTIIIDNLPKLSEIVTLLTNTYDVAQSLLIDDVLKEDLLGGVKEFIEPIEGTVKGLAATAIEANGRAEANASSSIGLFDLLRMFKDPQTQKLFRFVQAYLDIKNQKQ